MNNVFTVKRLCRAGIIAALYVALTSAFAPFAFGPIQVRPAEALCILPLFFPEAVPALYVGCMLANLTSPYFVYDVFIGSLATLLAALGTYLVGRYVKKDVWRLIFGGLFPVACNALIIPLIIVFLCDEGIGYESMTAAYFASVGSLALTESIWIYGLGTPLYFTFKRLLRRD